VCGVGVVDIGFAASARWQPVEKAELTSKVIAKIILKLIALPMKGSSQPVKRGLNLSFERNYKHESSNCDEKRSRKKAAAGQDGNGQR
jgi:hypothetical protein